jgi:hypothetical protein
MQPNHRQYLIVVLSIAAVLIGIVWIYTRSMPVAFMESGYPVTAAKQSLLSRCDLGDVVVLGDSHAEGSVMPLEMPAKTANLGLGALSPVEMYFVARKVLNCPNPPKLVLDIHSLEAFSGVGEGLWKRALRFGLVSFSDVREIGRQAGALGDPSLEKVNTNDGLTGLVRDLAYGYGFPSIYTSSLVAGRVFGRYQPNMELLGKISARRGYVEYPPFTGTAVVGSDAKIVRFAPPPLAEFYFDATLRTLTRAGVAVVFLTPPIAEATGAALQPGVADAFASYLQTHAGQVSGVPPDRLGIVLWPDRLFVDGGHLTEEGARLFSRRLAPCVRQWLDHPSARTPCDFTWRPADAE